MSHDINVTIKQVDVSVNITTPSISVELGKAGSTTVIQESNDNLGNHTATENLQMSGHWISQDGDDEGILLDSAGNALFNKNITLGVNGTSTVLTKLGNNSDDHFFIGTAGSFRIQRASSGSETFRTQIAGDTAGRLIGTSDGRLRWGGGVTSGTVNLGYGGSDTLRVYNNLRVDKGITAENDIEVKNSVSGVLLKSPNGTRWRLQVDNSGVLTTTSI